MHIKEELAQIIRLMKEGAGSEQEGNLFNKFNMGTLLDGMNQYLERRGEIVASVDGAIDTLKSIADEEPMHEELRLIVLKTICSDLAEIGTHILEMVPGVEIREVSNEQTDDMDESKNSVKH